MIDCAKCFAAIEGEAAITSEGVLCWFCLVALIIAGELQPLEREKEAVH